MAFITIDLPPGIFANGTDYQSKGRWHDANLIRFEEGEIKPVSGWQLRSSAAAFTGLARSLLSWRDNTNNRWIAVGTHQKLYIQDEAGTNYDVTPIRKTSTLAANQFAATNGSKNVVVTDNAHGAIVGDFVVVSSATAVGGIPVGDLNATQTVTAVTTNTWTFQVATTATSTTTGGGTPTLNYQITAGRADATQNLGFGGGTYGTGDYGVQRPANAAFLPATVWSLDAWGQTLVACSDTDGKIYQWSLVTSTPAAVVSGAPTGNAAIVVTEQGFLLALGAGADGRKLQWCDQQAITTWSASATNQAGDYDLPTVGTLQCGKAIPGGALVFTDVDVWLVSYIGTPLVFGFERRGSGCGVISKGAVAARDSLAVWMGRGGFWLYDGQSVRPLPCDVRKHVYDDLNLNQSSKVAAVNLADHGEVWWFYPSASSNECDRYVCWAYRESERLGRNIWTVGTLGRTCGSGRGVFSNPLMVDASGYLYEHDTGLNYDGAEPYIETSPLEIGNGDVLGEIQRIIPDELANGDVTATIYGRNWPNGDETNFGTFTLDSPTDLLVQARQVRIRFTGSASTIWRVGQMRLDVVPGDPI